MVKIKIDKVNNNMDKKKTYSILNKNLKTSYENNNYHEVINLSYAMIEDRLLTILDLLYIIDRNKYPYYPPDEIDSILRPILKYNLEAEKNKIYKINNISTKLKILEKILNTPQSNFYIYHCKEQIEGNIGISKFLYVLSEIKKWNLIRNEIIHSSFNKNYDDLNNKTKECAIKGYNLSLKIKNYTNKLKTNINNISVKDQCIMFNLILNQRKLKLSKDNLTDYKAYSNYVKPLYSLLLDGLKINEDTFIYEKNKNVLSLKDKKTYNLNFLIQDFSFILKTNLNNDVFISDNNTIINSILKNQKCSIEFITQLIITLNYKRFATFVKGFKLLPKVTLNNYKFWAKLYIKIKENPFTLGGYCLNEIINTFLNNFNYPDEKISKKDCVKIINNKLIYVKDILISELYEYGNKEDKALSLLKQSSRLFGYISETLLSKKPFVLDAVKQNGYALEYASEELQNDKEVVLAAVRTKDIYIEDDYDGFMLISYGPLKYASKELQNDREVILEAVKHNAYNFRYAPNSLQNDKDIVLAAIEQDGLALGYVPDELKGNKEIVLVAVQQDGSALQYASQELQSNKEVVLAAVQQNGYALEYASGELRNDKDIVLAAVQENGFVLEDVSKELQNDKKVVLAAVKQNINALKYASEELRNDKEFILSIVSQNGSTLEYISKELQNDKDVVLAAVKQDGMALKYASDNLRDNKEIVLAAIAQEEFAAQYASERLKSNGIDNMFTQEELIEMSDCILFF